MERITSPLEYPPVNAMHKVSKERLSIISVKRIDEQGLTLAVTSNRSNLRGNTVGKRKR
jgi:hypothetical protein